MNLPAHLVLAAVIALPIGLSRAQPGAQPAAAVRDYHLTGPYHTLKNYRPLDWNEVVVTVRGGLAHATCNGEVLIDAFAVPATGPIGIESDRGQIEYRRLRVLEAK